MQHTDSASTNYQQTYVVHLAQTSEHLCSEHLLHRPELDALGLAFQFSCHTISTVLDPLSLLGESHC